MFKSTLTAVALAAAFVMPPLFAADEPAPKHAATHFDANIDTWAEGAVMAIDADGGTLTVRGVKRPYATAYAGMLKEIHSEVSKLPQDQRPAKEAEIRAKWSKSLADARATETASKDGDFTFYLPKEKDRIAFFNESYYYDREAAKPVDVKVSESERQAMIAFKDLKVGDRVSVGYDAGVVYNTAHVVVKVREASDDAQKPVKASLQTNEPTLSDKASAAAAETKAKLSQAATDAKANVSAATKLDADTENMRQIRRSLVADDTLSVKAKNTNIHVENGTFTLKGTVDSEVEKLAVEKKAAAVVGQERVINQLEVLNKPAQ